MNHFVQCLDITPRNGAASSPSFRTYFGQNGQGAERMAAAQLERPFKRQLYLQAERRVVAGVVRSRTAASWQRNSQKTPVLSGGFAEVRMPGQGRDATSDLLSLAPETGLSSFASRKLPDAIECSRPVAVIGT
jgi:hypothetical protein